MNKVYILVHESYAYWDNDYDVNFKTFKDKESAMNYLKIMKQEFIDNACDHENLTVEELRNAYDSDDGYVYAFEDEEDYFRLDIEEYGYDCAYISDQDVMSFNI
jgi:hypothetical protein